MILSIILGAIILALSYYEAYIYADIIISVSEYIIPMNIIMTVYQIISNAIGVLRILDTIRTFSPETKFFQAS